MTGDGKSALVKDRGGEGQVHHPMHQTSKEFIEAMEGEAKLGVSGS
jgi:hypothetical protein